jgi:hypothetical protein
MLKSIIRNSVNLNKSIRDRGSREASPVENSYKRFNSLNRINGGGIRKLDMSINKSRNRESPSPVPVKHLDKTEIRIDSIKKPSKRGDHSINLSTGQN